jgi:hypothetical protein
MNNLDIKIEKRIYNCPVIVCVILDNEISLSLESTPPDGPDEGAFLTPEYLNNNPFKSNLG